MRQGADASNYTGVPDASWDALAGAIDALFPQAIDPPAGYPGGCTRAQCQWALDHGKLLVPYIWKWFSTGLDDVKRRLDLLVPFTGQIDALAADIEDTTPGPVTASGGPSRRLPAIPPGALERFTRQPSPQYPGFARARPVAGALDTRLAELQEMFALLDTFPTKSGLKTLVYSGRWYWTAYLGDTTLFSADRLCWGSLYDGIFEPAKWTPFGGWSQLAIKQPFGTSTIAGVGNLDPDVLADSFLASPPPRRLGLSGPGIDVDPLLKGAAPAPAYLAQLGFTWARFVERDTPEVRAYADSLLQAGLTPVGVVTGETQGKVLAHVKLKMLGNEADTEDSNPAKWPAGDAAAYRRELDTYTGTYPQFDWLIGGLASGDFNAGFLRTVLGAGPVPSNVVGVSVHPWAKNVTEARAWLQAVVAGAGGLPLVVGEYNRPPSEIGEYLCGLRWLDSVVAWAWYCWSDVQSLGSEGQRFGLVDEGGSVKPELVAVQGALRPRDIDYAWIARKPKVVATAGELLSAAQQLDNEASHRGFFGQFAPRADVIRRLAGDVQGRAEAILT